MSGEEFSSKDSNEEELPETVSITDLPKPQVKELKQLAELVDRQEQVVKGLERQRALLTERSRLFIAIALLASIGGTIFGTFLYIFLPFFFPARAADADADKYNEAKELITLIWTSEVGLIGGAIGYYFGSGTASRKSD